MKIEYIKDTQCHSDRSEDLLIGRWKVTDDSGEEISNCYRVQIDIQPYKVANILVHRYLSATDDIQAALVGHGKSVTVCPKCKGVQFETEMP